jgi:hypothetical protein
VNAWSSPTWVFGNHAKDEFAQLYADKFSSDRSSMP